MGWNHALDAPQILFWLALVTFDSDPGHTFLKVDCAYQTWIDYIRLTRLPKVFYLPMRC